MKRNTQYWAILISVIIAGFLLYYFRQIVFYILIAWVLSMIGKPLMQFFQKRIKFWKFHVGPVISAILTMLIYIIVIFLFFRLFAPMVVEQTANLAGVDYSSIANALQEPFDSLNKLMEKYGLSDSGFSAEEQVREALKGWFKPEKIGSFFSSILSTAGTLIFAIFAIMFMTFFFLKEQGLFGSYMVSFFPKKFEKQVQEALESVSSLLTRYFGGVLLQIAIITVVVSIALSAFGVKNAILIGFLAGILNVIPYFGPMIGAAFGIFITISTNLDLEFYNQMMPLLIKVAVVFAAMQLLDNLVLQPFIFSKSVMAHPLEIFIVILIGAKINGIVGMMLAIPTYTVLRVIARVFLSQRRIVSKLTERMEDEDT